MSLRWREMKRYHKEREGQKAREREENDTKRLGAAAEKPLF